VPYTIPALREKFYCPTGGGIADLVDQVYGAADLTFVLYKISRDYWFRNGKRYQQIAEIRGALMGVVHELDRRYFDEYEADALTRNGDVF
jgi:hypothetical protein